MKNFLDKMRLSLLSVISSILQPKPKYSYTADSSVRVNKIPDESPTVVGPFYSLVVQPDQYYELVELTEKSATLTHLGNYKTITIQKALFELNFKACSVPSINLTHSAHIVKQ